MPLFPALVIALGVPLVLVVGGTLLLERQRGNLPGWLQRLSRREALLWTTGVGLLIGLGLLRFLRGS
jgi:hypothetical protein